MSTHRPFPQGRTTLVSLLLRHTSTSSICRKGPSCQGLLLRPGDFGITAAQGHAKREHQHLSEKWDSMQRLAGVGGGAGEGKARICGWEAQCTLGVSHLLLKIQSLKVKFKDALHWVHTLPALAEPEYCPIQTAFISLGPKATPAAPHPSTAESCELPAEVRAPQGPASSTFQQSLPPGGWPTPLLPPRASTDARGCPAVHPRHTEITVLCSSGDSKKVLRPKGAD